MNRDDFVGYAVPAFTLGLGLVAWEGVVRYFAIPHYLCRRRASSSATLFTDWPTLSSSLWVTLSITLEGAACWRSFGSVALAVIFAQSRLVERAFYPFAVAMQVTPIVAIAPLLLIYLTPDCGGAGLRVPGRVLSAARQHHPGTVVGGSQSRRSLQHVSRLALPAVHAAEAPGALPYFLAGLRISGGLALIGAIVAEIAAGSAGQGSGLAYRIVESGFRLNIPRMFAALLLISVAGITIHVASYGAVALAAAEWHDSERASEN